jgi:hypothetical protein
VRDITELMDHFTVVARSVWNMGFRPEFGFRNFDSRDHFEQIKELLFKALVVAPLEEGHHCDLNTLPDPIYQVVPAGPEPVPIIIRRPREGDSNWHWDDPVEEITAADSELQFLDYFDWDHLNYADFQYYRVRISVLRAHPHLVGREALVEHQCARVFATGGQP